MPVHCSHCQEELLGAVNRCWRCGRTFQGRYDGTGVPPVCRSPVFGPLDETEAAAAAEVATQQGDVMLAEAIDDHATASPPVINATVSNTAPTTVPRNVVRRGSPFSTSATLMPVAQLGQATRPTRIGDDSAEQAAMGAAITSMVLAIVSLSLTPLFPIGAFLISMVGLGLGIWGLRAPRRAAAIVGLILCCLGLSYSGFHSAVQLYETIYGFSPWEANEREKPSIVESSED